MTDRPLPDVTGQTVLLSSLRDEAPFVVEFVAHHRAIGFDEIIIASNDCSDGTHEILAALDRIGAIRHLPCQPGPKDAPQIHAFRQARQRFGLDRCDWLMILDVDEFLNIHIGGGLLSDLLAHQPPGTDLCLIHWACFGSSGHIEWRPGLSRDLYTQRLTSANGDNGMVKSLRRSPAQWGDLGNHHPFAPLGDHARRVSFAGGLRVEDLAAARLTRAALNFVQPTAESHKIAQINHYATRTEDCFALRHKRGDGTKPLNAENDRHNALYFARLSRGKNLDLTIHRTDAAFHAVHAALMADPAVRAAHEEGLRRYQVAIDAYWQKRAAMEL